MQTIIDEHFLIRLLLVLLGLLFFFDTIWSMVNDETVCIAVNYVGNAVSSVTTPNPCMQSPTQILKHSVPFILAASVW